MKGTAHLRLNRFWGNIHHLRDFIVGKPVCPAQFVDHFCPGGQLFDRFSYKLFKFFAIKIEWWLLRVLICFLIFYLPGYILIIGSLFTDLVDAPILYSAVEIGF